MKTAKFTLIMVTLLCLNLKGYSQELEKPQIQVSFNLVKDTPMYIAFEDDIDAINTQALDTIIKGLNNYIGFVNFTTESAPYQLTFTLNEKIDVGDSTSFFHEYWLFLNLTDTLTGDALSHQCKFIGINEINDVLSKPESLLNKLGRVWVDYLKVAYNMELVSILFDEVALNLPDSSHYVDKPGTKEAILPYKQEALKIDAEKSEFSITVIGKDVDNEDTKDIHKEVSFRGLVQEQNSKLLNCIRLKLNNTLPGITPEKGKVFITDYRRKIYTAATEDDDSEFD
ncbi:hypothetical protein MHTCC0001_20790 [Flavobacteriaceae bacterium MHTCC 0001]